MRRLAAEGRFDYLLIESSGISEPLPVAATFEFRDAEGESLSDVARLDTMVTVVDAANLLRDYSSHEFPRERGESAGDGDDRTLVHLLTDQIEFAGVVILNKISDAGRQQADAARKIVKTAAIGVVVADTPEGLSVIHRPGCAAAIWRRQPPRSFQDWIDRLDPSQLPQTRIILQSGAVRDAVLHCCDMAGAAGLRGTGAPCR